MEIGHRVELDRALIASFQGVADGSRAAAAAADQRQANRVVLGGVNGGHGTAKQGRARGE